MQNTSLPSRTGTGASSCLSSAEHELAWRASVPASSSSLKRVEDGCSAFGSCRGRPGVPLRCFTEVGGGASSMSAFCDCQMAFRGEGGSGQGRRPRASARRRRPHLEVLLLYVRPRLVRNGPHLLAEVLEALAQLQGVRVRPTGAQHGAEVYLLVAELVQPRRDVLLALRRLGRLMCPLRREHGGLGRRDPVLRQPERVGRRLTATGSAGAGRWRGGSRCTSPSAALFTLRPALGRPLRAGWARSVYSLTSCAFRSFGSNATSALRPGA